LKREDLQKLPIGQNWLIPGGELRGRFGAMLGGISEGFVGEDADPPENETTAGADKDPLKAFFSRPREAAATLARLLNDGRFLRVMQNEVSFSHEYFSSDSDEQRLAMNYSSLPRPLELGELAWRLIQPLFPQSERIFIENGDRSAATLAWLQRIAGQTDEELAWESMRTASGPYDNAFQNSLSYLVKHGSESTVTKLREVFLDPAVWSNNIDSLLPVLEAYLKRLNDGAAPFMEQLKPVVVKAVNSQKENVEFSDSQREEFKKEFK
jgi:hypothetical protein